MRNLIVIGALVLVVGLLNTVDGFEYEHDAELDEGENPEDNEVASDCEKPWESRSADDDEIRMVAEYGAHVASQKRHYEFKDRLVRVIDGQLKDCRWPRYRITAIYGQTVCKTKDVDATDCNFDLTKAQKMCEIYIWVPQGKGGRLAVHKCTPYDSKINE